MMRAFDYKCIQFFFWICQTQTSILCFSDEFNFRIKKKKRVAAAAAIGEVAFPHVLI